MPSTPATDPVCASSWRRYWASIGPATAKLAPLQWKRSAEKGNRTLLSVQKTIARGAVRTRGSGQDAPRDALAGQRYWPSIGPARSGATSVRRGVGQVTVRSRGRTVAPGAFGSVTWRTHVGGGPVVDRHGSAVKPRFLLLRRGDGIGSGRHVEVQDAAVVCDCRRGYCSIETRYGDSRVRLDPQIAGGARRLSYAGGNGSRGEREGPVNVALSRKSRRRRSCRRGWRVSAPSDR